MEIRPVSGNQRATPIRQDEKEQETALTMCVAMDVKSFTVERVMWASDGHLRGKVAEVGSVWWFPSIIWTTNG